VPINAPAPQHEQERWNGLRDYERAEHLFRMSCLQDAPGDGGGVHAAADHRHEVRRKKQREWPVSKHSPLAFSVPDFRAAFVAPEVHGRCKNCTTPELRNPRQK
jgi:hypothetical protein